MTKTDRKDIYERTTDRIIERLEEGVVPWHQPWKAGFNLPCNANSKRTYRGWNLVVTLFSGHESPYWATYKGWKKLGGQVRKGEKGTLVVGWKSVEREKDVEEDGVTRRVTKRSLVGFGYTVFNEEQVDGATVPEKAKGPELDPVEAAEQILETWRETQPECPIEVDRAGRAGYDPRGDRVLLPEFQSFESAEHYYKTAYHELGHATGAEKRLNRFEPGEDPTNFGSESYSKEELVAEFSASFVMATIGLEQTTTDHTAAYIKGWLRALKDDKRLLISAASKAQAAANFILDGGAPEEAATEAATTEGAVA